MKLSNTIPTGWGFHTNEAMNELLDVNSIIHSLKMEGAY